MSEELSEDLVRIKGLEGLIKRLGYAEVSVEVWGVVDLCVCFIHQAAPRLRVPEG